MSSDKSNQLLIREAIRKIALGRSMERINLAPGGMSGIGTARMIHGYVAKIHDNPSDEEFSDYGGTIDVGEYPDETASAEPVIHKGVLLSAATNSEGGFLIVPALFSDVTIFMDAATRYAYVVNFSHVDILRLNARTETVIGVTEMEELDPENDSVSAGSDSIQSSYCSRVSGSFKLVRFSSFSTLLRMIFRVILA